MINSDQLKREMAHWIGFDPDSPAMPELSFVDLVRMSATGPTEERFAIQFIEVLAAMADNPLTTKD